MDWLLALEGGGTRSQAVLIDPLQRVCGSGMGGDVNTNFTAHEQAQHAVRVAVADALRQGQVDGAQVRTLVSALVGPRFGAETFGDLLPNAVYRYYGEGAVVFARAGVYRPHGLALVAATGATAWAKRQDDGRQLACGGWGSLLGDEGSAYALGLAVLRAAARAYEGRFSHETGLVGAVAAYFGIDVAHFRNDLVERAYHPPLGRPEVAALAPLATRLASQGDAGALCLVEKTARDLANLAMFAVRRMFRAEESFTVVAAGGMTAAGDLLLGPLRTDLASEFPQARLLLGSEDPAIALAKLARYDREDEEKQHVG